MSYPLDTLFWIAAAVLAGCALLELGWTARAAWQTARKAITPSPVHPVIDLEPSDSVIEPEPEPVPVPIRPARTNFINTLSQDEIERILVGSRRGKRA